MKAILVAILFFALPLAKSEAQCWRTVSVGFSHTLAIADDGTLWAWGKDNLGELGDGSFNVKYVPVPVGTANDWQDVSAGEGQSNSFSLAIKTDGTLWSWGNNAFGQLGDGTLVNRNYPMQVGVDTDWVSIAAGFTHAVAIKSNGTLWAWGDGQEYALGNGAFASVLAPEQLGTATNWVMIDAGNKTTLALRDDATAWGWGLNTTDLIDLNLLPVPAPTQRGINGSNVGLVTLGKSFSYDINLDGLVYAHGDDTFGERGGTTCSGCPSYYALRADGGGRTGAIIRTDGALWYTGITLGGAGQEFVSVFTQLGEATDWVQVSVGDQSGAALNAAGELWTWGFNAAGELGIGQGPGSTSLVQVVCPMALTIGEVGIQDPLVLYPDPVTDRLTINYAGAAKFDRIVVTDAVGRVVLDRAANGATLDVSDLDSGLHMVWLYSGKEVLRARFLKL